MGLITQSVTFADTQQTTSLLAFRFGLGERNRSELLAHRRCLFGVGALWTQLGPMFAFRAPAWRLQTPTQVLNLCFPVSLLLSPSLASCDLLPFSVNCLRARPRDGRLFAGSPTIGEPSGQWRSISPTTSVEELRCFGRVSSRALAQFCVTGARSFVRDFASLGIANNNVRRLRIDAPAEWGPAGGGDRDFHSISSPHEVCQSIDELYR